MTTRSGGGSRIRPDLLATALHVAQISHTPYERVQHWPLREVLLTSLRHTRNEQLRADAMERARTQRS